MSLLEVVFNDIVLAQAGPLALSAATRDEITAVLALIPLMSMNLRTALTVTDASPTGGSAATSQEFKQEPQRVAQDGSSCFQCGGEFEEDGRFPCPPDCGVALCSLECIWRHREGPCKRKDHPCPRFGERFAGSARLSKEVARAGIEVQEPFDLTWNHDYFSLAGKATLKRLESDEQLRAEHWAPECKLFSRARGRPITLRDGCTVRGPQPVRDASHVMGYPWL